MLKWICLLFSKDCYCVSFTLYKSLIKLNLASLYIPGRKEYKVMKRCIDVGVCYLHPHRESRNKNPETDYVKERKKWCIWLSLQRPTSSSHRWLTPQFLRSKKRPWSPIEVWSRPRGSPPRSPPRSSSGSYSALSYSGCTSGWNVRTSAPSAPSLLSPLGVPAQRRRRPRTGDRQWWTAPAAGTARYPRLSDRSRSSSRSCMPLCRRCLRGAAAVRGPLHGALEHNAQSSDETLTWQHKSERCVFKLLNQVLQFFLGLASCSRASVCRSGVLSPARAQMTSCPVAALCSGLLRCSEKRRDARGNLWMQRVVLLRSLPLPLQRKSPPRSAPFTHHGSATYMCVNLKQLSVQFARWEQTLTMSPDVTCHVPPDP